MLAIAARGPAENARRITNVGVRVIGITPQSPTLVFSLSFFFTFVHAVEVKLTAKNAFGIAINPKMLTVHARLLGAPQVQHDGSATPTHAEWTMIKKKFHKKARMPKWSYMSVGATNLSRKTLDQFKKAMDLCGLDKTEPTNPGAYRAEVRGYGDDELNDNVIMAEMYKVVRDQIPILLVILGSQSKAIYARVKYWADTTCGTYFTWYIYFKSS